MPPPPILPGFMALHGNRTEELLEAISEWLGRHPLGPLEPEQILVQNNGMAEWVRMQIAGRTGICAATQFSLPARFQWRVYRQVLGWGTIPEQSPLDQEPLVWRLMRLLDERSGILSGVKPAVPNHLDPDDPFTPLRAFLRPDDHETVLRDNADEPVRRYQLAVRIADLFDQYQVLRPDWLEVWGQGDAVLIDGRQQRQPMPREQRWQALLWQQLIEDLPPADRGLTRSALHHQVIEQLACAQPSGAQSPPFGLPRRIVVFGITHLPAATLELLAALSQHTQVILAIANPCRFHWADIIDGRELLRAARRRHSHRKGDLANVDLESMHLHAHPLLAAWGRQARDFIRQIDAHDDLEAARARFDLRRFDLFTEDLPPNASLLQQVQQHICDLLPLKDHDQRPIPATDRSIVFHVAHSPVRELEILHDQLLLLLARAAEADRPALRPRDIVVMVPDIDAFAPAIRAVFGQYDSRDSRFIPFDIADLSARGSTPLMGAVEWLMGIASDRVRLPELVSLLAVPAIAARLELAPESLEALTRWMQGSGIRWGLDASHRADLSLDACGNHQTAQFGLQRMLMGFAVGGASDPLDSTPPFAGIEAYGEVGGLEAGAVGALADLLEILRRWRTESAIDADPATWAGRLRGLIDSLFEPADDTDRQTVVTLKQSIEHWLEQCEAASFVERIPLAVAARVWLDTLERPSLGRRYRAGGVTFCTLTPMRAIPFEVVCLLGMNERDFPRRSPASDFDLIAQPGQGRPGDRARRNDDRQLMLEALLSARRVLYISWCGRSARDNSAQPPSVLVSQLRDYLTQGWNESVVAERTTVHPLQPFSRRYFEGDPRLVTLAAEWRAAHTRSERPGLVGLPESEGSRAGGERDPAFEEHVPLTIERLVQFLRNPVRAFFRHQLQVVFDEGEKALPDSEAFTVDGLERYGLIDELSRTLIEGLATRLRSPDSHSDALSNPPSPRPDADVPALLTPLIARLGRSGRLPLGGPGLRFREALQRQVEPMISAWCSAHAEHPFELARVALRHEHEGLVIEDWLDQRVATTEDAGNGLWIRLSATGLLQSSKGPPKLRVEKLIEVWIRSLLAAASGVDDSGLLIGKDQQVWIRPVEGDVARATLSELLRCWQDGQGEPLPVAPRTALAFIEADDKAGDDPDEKAARAYEGDDYNSFGEVEDECLARCFPDYASISESGRFPDLAYRLYGPLSKWAKSYVTLAPLPGATAVSDPPPELAPGVAKREE